MITIGVDPHRTVNEAVALDGEGQLLGRWRGANDGEGWQALADWAAEYGGPREYAVEGAWSYGRGLAQHLVKAGEPVYNVSPHLTAEGRRRARKRGKSDRQDAEAVARILRQERGQLPEVTGEDETNVLALLNGERELLKGESARLQNHLRAVLRQVDPVYERSLRALTTKQTLAALKEYVAERDDPVQTARAGVVRRLSQQLELVLGHMAEVAAEMEARANERYRALKSICGVDLLTAAQLAAEMGPGQRFSSDAALASWGGVAPIEASSGMNVRHRLSRSGNRQFNAIVHRIAVTQLRYSAAAKTYMERRRSEGKTRRESMRALKRYIVRAIYRQWILCFPPPHAPRTTSGCT